MQTKREHSKSMMGLAPIAWLFCEAYYAWRMRRAPWDKAVHLYSEWAKYDRLLRSCMQHH